MGTKTLAKDKVRTPADMRNPVFANGIRLSEQGGIIYIDLLHSGPELTGFDVVARVLVTPSTLAQVAQSTAQLAHDLLTSILPDEDDD